MNHAIAIKLIGQHRRSARSWESDAAIAQRFWKSYLSMGLAFATNAFFNLERDLSRAELTHFEMIVVSLQFVAAAGVCWQAWRFWQIRRLIAETKTQSL